MDKLRIAGVLLSLVGTVILSVRVTKLLEVLALAIKTHDMNFRVEALRANGQSVPNVRMFGNDTHIENAEKLGTKLLVLGFLLQIAGGVCHVLALL